MMKTIHVDFSSKLGPIKPMNAVNNGPTGMSERGTSNFRDYAALEIPYTLRRMGVTVLCGTPLVSA